MRPAATRDAASAAIALAAFATLAPPPAHAEVVSAAPARFELRHVVEMERDADAAWRRLIRVQDWWSGEHTYSGKASNLSLSLRPGGCWCERWSGGSVEHGRVVLAMTGRTLRIDGAFGPLQAMAARGMMTFDLEPLERPDGAPGRTRLTMTYVVVAAPESDLARLAPAVDRVLATQAARLAAR